MRSHHLVDPELLPLLDLLPGADMSAAMLPTARAMMAQRLLGQPGPNPSQILAVPGPVGAPDVPVRLFRPDEAGANLPAILHIHGGGFIVGMAAMNDADNAARAGRHGAVVVSVDYRLAPETPFPGPIEDCYAALEWLFAEAATLGVDPRRIVVTGESAGGGLAAALALLARDRGLPPLAGQVLTYPMLDPSSADSSNASTGEFVWTRASNRFGWAAMRGDSDIPLDRLGHFAPARATDLSGLAPACIAVGALDLFLDEDIAYATKLSHAGVPIELRVYPGAFHGFDLMAQARVSRQIAKDIVSATQRLLAVQSAEARSPRETP
ncbi:MAG: alpha/beta hydrolase [Rudaea sp.]|nr:alpha/beta hydrolase [Rudaea sp.]